MNEYLSFDDVCSLPTGTLINVIWSGGNAGQYTLNNDWYFPRTEKTHRTGRKTFMLLEPIGSNIGCNRITLVSI